MIEFMGQQGFAWWFGVVEDTNDPLKLGRVRVRIFGYHTEDKSALSTGDLPWAHPLQDLTSASISGVGKSPTGLLPGSHVFGFFRDGLNAQQPVVMFSVGGIPGATADKSKGFNDPSGVYPLEKDVPDTNRLATGNQTDKTIVEDKKNSVVGPVGVAWDPTETRRWNEPETPYKTIYPNNKVFATKSGMVEEWDDTPGKERHHTYHPSGSFEEVANGWEKDPDGTRVHKIKGNNYELIAGDDFIKINGKAEISIDGDCNVLIGKGLPTISNVNIQVEGNVNLQALRDMRTIVYGDWDIEVLGNYRERIFGNKYTTIQTGSCITNLNGPPGLASYVVDAGFGNVALKNSVGADLALSAARIQLNCPSRAGGAADPRIIPGIYPTTFGIVEQA